MFFRGVRQLLNGEAARREEEWKEMRDIIDAAAKAARRRSNGARKAAATRKRNKAARAGAAEGNQAGAGVSASFTPEPGQPAVTLTQPEPYLDHESDAVQL